MTGFRTRPIVMLTPVLALTAALAFAQGTDAPSEAVERQRAALAAATEGQGFGPQSPRDIARTDGANAQLFALAPPAERMNLCNIHFHDGAEHRGGAFTRYAGPGNGDGYDSGFLYTGDLTAAETEPTGDPVDLGAGEGSLLPGDTIEVHYVYSTATVAPGPTLGACVSDATANPQLRVEAQVMVLVNDPDAADFTELARTEVVDGYHQAPGRPEGTGTPVVYRGSTTGPGYNETGSPYEVTWSVRPEVIKVDFATIARWYDDNPFAEDHAHGVRNLVVNPALLSPIE